jgi:hypothetical protein
MVARRLEGSLAAAILGQRAALWQRETCFMRKRGTFHGSGFACEDAVGIALACEGGVFQGCTGASFPPGLLRAFSVAPRTMW